MLIKRRADIPSSDITDRKVYVNRRAFIRAAAVAAAGAAGAGALGCAADMGTSPQPAGDPPASPVGRFADVGKSPLSTTEPANTLEQISTYNNYYEFGTDKSSPSVYARMLKTEPWSVAVEGECAKPAVWHLEDILKGQTLEERIYRLRCVEAWSMVIPWIGFPLADFIARCEPTSKAKFVQFFTLADSAQMPGLRSPVLDWPYTEGLRMDEAMHPLTILSVGLYGDVLPNQNGAPIRLVVPWKYGFKSIKSIVRMRFVEQQPVSSWEAAARSEYGFYSNVNPTVDHPRWSQAKETRLPGFLRNHTTQMFNGYSEQVAHLYTGMDLRRNF